MGNLLQTILCCADTSEEVAQNNTTTKYQSTTNNRDIQKTNSNNPKQASSKKMSNPQPSRIRPNNGTGLQSSNFANTKTDVTVYEATDSTVETNDNGNISQINPNGTVLVKERTTNSNASQTGESSAISSNDADSEMSNGEGETEVFDDFLDLTKLQPGQAHAVSGWLLDPIPKELTGKKCLVLDLDETLVHSSFKYLRQADFVIPVDIDNQLHNVYVIKRPGVDEFLKRVGQIYEVVVFTASVSRYGDPLLDALDIHKSVHHRLFRDSCYNYQGNYIKNLSQIGRPLNKIIILDNSPASYIFHPQHAIPISSWFSDAHDNELLDILPFLEDLATDKVDDVGVILDINL